MNAMGRGYQSASAVSVLAWWSVLRLADLGLPDAGAEAQAIWCGRTVGGLLFLLSFLAWGPIWGRTDCTEPAKPRRRRVGKMTCVRN